MQKAAYDLEATTQNSRPADVSYLPRTNSVARTSLPRKMALSLACAFIRWAVSWARKEAILDLVPDNQMLIIESAYRRRDDVAEVIIFGMPTSASPPTSNAVRPWWKGSSRLRLTRPYYQPRTRCRITPCTLKYKRNRLAEHLKSNSPRACRPRYFSRPEAGPCSTTS